MYILCLSSNCPQHHSYLSSPLITLCSVRTWLCLPSPLRRTLIINPGYQKKLKPLLNTKKWAHIQEDEITKRNAQREIKNQIKIDKNIYKQKVEQNMTFGNSRRAWQSIKTMTSAPHKGRGKSNRCYW